MTIKCLGFGLFLTALFGVRILLLTLTSLPLLSSAEKAPIVMETTDTEEVELLTEYSANCSIVCNYSDQFGNNMQMYFLP